jgi:phosphoribosyl-ATP pyrophosphohydrolase
MKPFTLQDLFTVIEHRKTHPPTGSYTAQLFSAGEEKIGKKIVEETVEVLLAARSEGDQRLVEESADLVYHLFVLLAHRGLTLSDVENELQRRHEPTENPGSDSA